MAERRRSILEGRIKGIPYRDLAAEHNIAEGTARKDFTRALKGLNREHGEAFIHLYREQLDAVIRGQFELFTSDRVQARDRVAAGREIVRALERYSRFLGTDKTLSPAEREAERLASEGATAHGLLGGLLAAVEAARNDRSAGRSGDTPRTPAGPAPTERNQGDNTTASS